MADQLIQLATRTWHVVEHGRGEPVLLLHGFTGSAASWVDVMERLSSDFQCIAVDITGHGQTSAPMDAEEYRMDVISQDLLEVMDRLGHHRFHVLGYSMGGRLGLYLTVTAEERVRSLVLESSSPGLQSVEERTTRRQHDNRLADKIEAEGVTAFVGEWEKLPLFSSQKSLAEPVKQRQREIRLLQRAHGLANSLRGMGTGVQPNLWNDLPALHVPLLLITGRLDAKFSAIAERMKVLKPDARHVTVDEAGHTVHMEQLSKYVEVVSQFLKTAESGGTP